VCPVVGATADAAMRYDYARAYTGIAVAEVRFVTDCTSEHAHWIVARGVSGSREYLFGGPPGCSLWAETPKQTYAVIRYAQTAGIFPGPENACVAFPGGGLVTFETLDSAEAFARSYGWKRN
jgi:hypothetical protein